MNIVTNSASGAVRNLEEAATSAAIRDSSSSRDCGHIQDIPQRSYPIVEIFDFSFGTTRRCCDTAVRFCFGVPPPTAVAAAQVQPSLPRLRTMGLHGLRISQTLPR
jgi:hypothetical protein